MGQKCSCFDKEVEANLEKNSFSVSNTKENEKEEEIKAAKKSLIQKQTSIKSIQEKPSNDDYIKSLKIITQNVCSWFFRKKFIENKKKSLENHSQKLFQEIYNSESIKNLNKISEKIKNNFDINGWKELYEEFPLKIEDLPHSEFQRYHDNNNNYNHNNNFDLNKLIYDNNYEDLLGITYNRELIYLKPAENYNKYDKEEIRFKQNKDKDNSFIYTGQVNKFGEKHGEGILYTLEGSYLSGSSLFAISMEQGIWYNNHLIGWVRKILSNGIYYECKKKLN